jgi:hypothetical protein
MIEEGGCSPEERIVYAFRRAIARRPAPSEIAVLRRGLDRYLSAYCSDPRAADELIRHGESPTDPRIDRAELAAYTALAGVILNLDETISQE